MAISNTPPKSEDYGLTSDRVEWLSKHIPELESWEQGDKKPLDYIANVAAGLVVGIVAGVVAGVVAGWIVGIFGGVVAGGIVGCLL